MKEGKIRKKFILLLLVSLAAITIGCSTIDKGLDFPALIFLEV